MSKKMIKALATALDLSATAIQTPVRMNESPFLAGGGQGGVAGGARNAILSLSAALPASSIVLIQGHDAPNGPDDTAPDEADAGWTLVATLDPDSPLKQEIELMPWMRTNITDAAVGTLTAVLEGVQ